MERRQAMSKITIKLTPEQSDRILQETGDELRAFTFAKLESRDAPKVGGSSGFSPGEGRLYRGGGEWFVRINPS
jgi:hypothetical protein